MVHSSAAWFQRFRAMPLEDHTMKRDEMVLNLNSPNQLKPIFRITRA